MKSVIAAFLTCGVVFSAQAQVIGTFGTLYDIQEEDSVAYIKRRLTEMEKDGTIKKKQQEAVARVREHLLHPPPVSGITTAKSHRVFYWDPTFTLNRPITDGHGRIIYPVGYRFNPLMYGGLSKRLLFIDQRDPRQVKLAVIDKENYPRDKIILTAGSFFDLTKQLHEQVYYDQAGYLTKRFGIKHVPALVAQDGLKLKIEEGL